MPVFDYKKEFKKYYLPKQRPEIVDIPAMQFIAVRGSGNPNAQNGSYQNAVGLLYAISYTIKMSWKTGFEIENYFPYVIPPLEGFWWLADGTGIDYRNKSAFQWISVMRLPEFVTEDIFEWAKEEAARKKRINPDPAELFRLTEGVCVQCMHVGSYDEEPATIIKMEQYAASRGYALDFTDTRRHHEIYLSDPRKTAPDKLRTVIRHPVAKID